MKERGIIFSAPMVRAILEGRKSQTRRVVKEQHLMLDGGGHPFTQRWDEEEGVNWRTDVRCPYGQPGDRLWVRETWQAWNQVNVEYDEWEPLTREVRMVVWAEWVEQNGEPDKIEYRATSESVGPWTPAIHMPRWASRITLELTEVRVQRLQEISEEDAKAEGVEAYRQVSWTGYDPRTDAYPTAFGESAPDWMVHPRIRVHEKSARHGFQDLWDSIHGDGAWDSNPWLWALSFRVVKP